MTLFWRNKLYTSLVLLGLYGGAWWMLGTEASSFWVIMLFLYMVTGYGHFLLGFGYQTRALFKKTKTPWSNLGKIWGLSFLLLIPFAISLQSSQWSTYVMLFVIGYFVWHGALNEKTLYEREYKKFNPAFFLIGGILVCWSINSFGHPSAFFDAQYNFDPAISTMVIQQFWENFNMPIIQTLSIGMTLLWAGWMGRRHLYPVLSLLALGGLGYIIFSPFSFVVLLSLILSYHFIMWWIYYAQVMEGTTWWLYILWSVLVHGAAVLIIGVGYYEWFESSVLVDLYQTWFSIPVFLMITFLHITTSFFNEDPIKKWLKIN